MEQFQPRLLDLKYQIDSLNVIQMYLSILFIIFGCFGNLLSLIVLIRAQKQIPRIYGTNYLVSLTASNLIYLILYFYTNTSSQIAWYLKDFKKIHTILKELNLFDSNDLVCKLVGFMESYANILHIIIILAFSLERVLIIHFPRFIREFKKHKNNLTMILLFAIGFILESYLIFFLETISTKESSIMLIESNSSIMINFKAIRPTSKDKFCSYSSKHSHILFQIHFNKYLFIFISYIIISVSLVLMVLKLERRKKSRLMFAAKRSVNQRNKKPVLTKRRNSEVLQHGNSISTSFMFHFRFRTKRIKKYLGYRLENSRMLLTISLSFILLNFPYFVLKGAQIFNLKFLNTSNTEGLLIDKMIAKKYLIIIEIFKLANFSLTGLLFFLSGRVFRTHTKNLFKKYFCN
jgi:hypothetical protein